ncbi:MAG: FAD-dependent oxidoreductase [Pseudomonadota bacterium]|nr:FAD-dependent oxidoreductase [Pseudomonadota bacterium]
MPYEFDVLVVGAGTAGVPAALGAAARGLRVALVEAAEEIGGTLHLSSASISAAGTSLQKAAGVEDSPDAHFADCLRINHGTGDPELLRLWVDEAGDMIEWLLSIGWTCDPGEAVLAPEHDLYDRPRTYRSTNQGFSLIEAYQAQIDTAVAQGHLTVMTGTRFCELLLDHGQVCGIVAKTGEEVREIAARAVILTTGGFSGSARHWQELHGLVPLRYHVETVRGDAIDPVRTAGGRLWFTDYCLPAFGGTRRLDSPASAWIHSDILPSRRPPWEIYVNAHGERFMPEDEPSIDARERAVMAQPGWAFWMIWDERIREDAPPVFRWSDEQLDELLRGDNEDFVVAENIGELARLCGLPEKTLTQTVTLYNAGQAVGSDMWRRQHLPAPIARGPFYAVRHYGCSISCYPGVQVNKDLQVVSTSGDPIEGLYAAGEVIGIGFLGHGFLSGSIVSSAITFGRKLGREVLA